MLGASLPTRAAIATLVVPHVWKRTCLSVKKRTLQKSHIWLSWSQGIGTGNLSPTGDRILQAGPPGPAGEKKRTGPATAHHQVERSSGMRTPPSGSIRNRKPYIKGNVFKIFKAEGKKNKQQETKDTERPTRLHHYDPLPTTHKHSPGTTEQKKLSV